MGKIEFFSASGTFIIGCETVLETVTPCAAPVWIRERELTLPRIRIPHLNPCTVWRPRSALTLLELQLEFGKTTPQKKLLRGRKFFPGYHFQVPDLLALDSDENIRFLSAGLDFTPRAQVVCTPIAVAPKRRRRVIEVHAPGNCWMLLPFVRGAPEFPSTGFETAILNEMVRDSDIQIVTVYDVLQDLEDYIENDPPRDYCIRACLDEDGDVHIQNVRVWFEEYIADDEMSCMEFRDWLYSLCPELFVGSNENAPSEAVEPVLATATVADSGLEAIGEYVDELYQRHWEHIHVPPFDRIIPLPGAPEIPPVVDPMPPLFPDPWLPPPPLPPVEMMPGPALPPAHDWPYPMPPDAPVDHLPPIPGPDFDLPTMQPGIQLPPGMEVPEMHSTVFDFPGDGPLPVDPALPGIPIHIPLPDVLGSALDAIHAAGLTLGEILSNLQQGVLVPMPFVMPALRIAQYYSQRLGPAGSDRLRRGDFAREEVIPNAVDMLIANACDNAFNPAGQSHRMGVDEWLVDMKRQIDRFSDNGVLQAGLAAEVIRQMGGAINARNNSPVLRVPFNTTPYAMEEIMREFPDFRVIPYSFRHPHGMAQVARVAMMSRWSRDLLAADYGRIHGVGLSARQANGFMGIVHNCGPKMSGRDEFRHCQQYSAADRAAWNRVSQDHRFQDCPHGSNADIVLAPFSTGDISATDFVRSMIKTRNKRAWVLVNVPVPFLDERIDEFVDPVLRVKYVKRDGKISMTFLDSASAGYANDARSLMSWVDAAPQFIGHHVTIEEKARFGTCFWLEVMIGVGRPEQVPTAVGVGSYEFLCLPLLRPNWRQPDGVIRHFAVPARRFRAMVSFLASIPAGDAVFHVGANKLRGQLAEVKIGKTVIEDRLDIGVPQFFSYVGHALNCLKLAQKDYDCVMPRMTSAVDHMFARRTGNPLKRLAAYLTDLFSFKLTHTSSPWERSLPDRFMDLIFGANLDRTAGWDMYEPANSFMTMSNVGAPHIPDPLNDVIGLTNLLQNGARAAWEYVAVRGRLAPRELARLQADMGARRAMVDAGVVRPVQPVRRAVAPIVRLPPRRVPPPPRPAPVAAPVSPTLSAQVAALANEQVAAPPSNRPSVVPSPASVQESLPADVPPSVPSVDSGLSYATLEAWQVPLPPPEPDEAQELEDVVRWLPEALFTESPHASPMGFGPVYVPSVEPSVIDFLDERESLPPIPWQESLEIEAHLVPLPESDQDSLGTPPIPERVHLPEPLVAVGPEQPEPGEVDVNFVLRGVRGINVPDCLQGGEMYALPEVTGRELSVYDPARALFPRSDFSTSLASDRFYERFHNYREIRTACQNDFVFDAPDQGIAEIISLACERDAGASNYEDCRTEFTSTGDARIGTVSFIPDPDAGELHDYVQSFFKQKHVNQRMKTPQLCLGGVPGSGKSSGVLAFLKSMKAFSLVVTPSRALAQDWRQKANVRHIQVVTQHRCVSTRMKFNIVVIDEVFALDKSVVGVWLSYANKIKAKVILLGDPWQRTGDNETTVPIDCPILKRRRVNMTVSNSVPQDAWRFIAMLNGFDRELFTSRSDIMRSIAIIPISARFAGPLLDRDRCALKLRSTDQSGLDAIGAVSIGQAQGLRPTDVIFDLGDGERMKNWLRENLAMQTVLFSRHTHSMIVLCQERDILGDYFGGYGNLDRIQIVNGLRPLGERQRFPMELDNEIYLTKMPSSLTNSATWGLEFTRTIAEFVRTTRRFQPDTPELVLDTSTYVCPVRKCELEALITKHTNFDNFRDHTDAFNWHLPPSRGLRMLGELDLPERYGTLRSGLDDADKLGEVFRSSERGMDAWNIITRQFVTSKAYSSQASVSTKALAIFARFVECYAAPDFKATIDIQDFSAEWLRRRAPKFLSQVGKDVFREDRASVAFTAFAKTQSKPQKTPDEMRYNQTIVSNHHTYSVAYGEWSGIAYQRLREFVRKDVILDYGYSDAEIAVEMIERGICPKSVRGNMQVDVSMQDSSHSAAHVLAFCMLLEVLGVPKDVCDEYFALRSEYKVKSMASSLYAGEIHFNLPSGDPFTLLANIVQMSMTIACRFEEADKLQGIYKGDDGTFISPMYRAHPLATMAEIANVTLKIDYDLIFYHAGRFHNGRRFLVDPVRAVGKHICRLPSDETDTKVLYLSYLDRATDYSDSEIAFLTEACVERYPRFDYEDVDVFIRAAITLRRADVFFPLQSHRPVTGQIIQSPTDCATYIARLVTPPGTNLKQFRGRPALELMQLFESFGAKPIFVPEKAMFKQTAKGLYISPSHCWLVLSTRDILLQGRAGAIMSAVAQRGDNVS